MSMFSRANPRPQPIAPKRSRFQLILDDLDVIHQRLVNVMDTFDSLVSDLEKARAFTAQFRTDLAKSIEERGEKVLDPINIEQEIKDIFTGKKNDTNSATTPHP